MITEFYKQSQKCGYCPSGTDYIMCRKYTYAACLEYLNNNGIIVKTPSHVVTPLNIGDAALNAVHDVEDNAYQPGYFDQGLLNDEDSFESDLLRCRNLWEKSEADVFVSGNILTGIPIISDKNTLRVDNGSHTYSIPIKKIECIRTAGGLSFPRTEHFNKNDTDSIVNAL